VRRAEFFDHHAANWDRDERDDIGVRIARVVEHADILPGQRVLDVGTGTGVVVPFLVDALGPGGKVTAIDISAEMLATAQTKGFAGDVEYLLLDAEDSGLPDDSFDRVICNAVFPHFEDKPAAMGEMFRLLKSEGILVISHPIGREAVNRLHLDAGAVVAEDRVPTPEQMITLLQHAGMVDVEVIDEPEFYLARARKP
jgi:ubiquinone/menaquinone biosynthesis C-methylase UbiE